MNIEQVRADISERRASHGKMQVQLQQLSEKRRAVSNWLRGHEARGQDELKAMGCLEQHQEKKRELSELDQQISDANRSINTLNGEIDGLSALRFGEDEVLALALRDYREAQEGATAILNEEKRLSDEKANSDGALSQAKLALSAVQSRKSKALSVADVDEASRAVAEAQQRVSNTEILLGNLDHALESIGNKTAKALTGVAECESKVWKAHCALIVAELKTTPEFSRVANELEHAYAASVAAGNFSDFGRFMSHVFLGEGNVNPDHAAILARKEDARRALHLAEASA